MYITCWLADDGKCTIQFTEISVLSLFIFFVEFIHDDVIEALIEHKMYTQSIYKKHI